MNESTGRKMGPRESGIVEAFSKRWDRAPNMHEGLRDVARLADALEKALDEWDSLRDAFVDGRFTPDDRLGIGTEDAKKIAQLRAVLAEVDRG